MKVAWADIKKKIMDKRKKMMKKMKMKRGRSNSNSWLALRRTRRPSSLHSRSMVGPRVHTKFNAHCIRLLGRRSAKSTAKLWQRVWTSSLS